MRYNLRLSKLTYLPNTKEKINRALTYNSQKKYFRTSDSDMILLLSQVVECFDLITP